MAERRSTVWHHTMTPPPYMEFMDHDPPKWDRPAQSRAQELAEYAQHREQGGPIVPELQQRLFEQRQRQVQHHLRTRSTDAIPQ